MGVSLLALVTAGALVLAASPPAAQVVPLGSGHTARPHHPSPSHFTKGRVTNPWFPLHPGARYTYRGPDHKAHTRDVMTATYPTRGVECGTCRGVFDGVGRNGRRS